MAEAETNAAAVSSRSLLLDIHPSLPTAACSSAFVQGEQLTVTGGLAQRANQSASINIKTGQSSSWPSDTASPVTPYEQPHPVILSDGSKCIVSLASAADKKLGYRYWKPKAAPVGKAQTNTIHGEWVMGACIPQDQPDARRGFSSCLLDKTGEASRVLVFGGHSAPASDAAAGGSGHGHAQAAAARTAAQATPMFYNTMHYLSFHSKRPADARIDRATWRLVPTCGAGAGTAAGTPTGAGQAPGKGKGQDMVSPALGQAVATGTGTGRLPEPRAYASCVYVPHMNCAVVHGGVARDGRVLADLWLLNMRERTGPDGARLPKEWIEVDLSPTVPPGLGAKGKGQALPAPSHALPTRCGHSMLLCPNSSGILILGGCSNASILPIPGHKRLAALSPASSSHLLTFTKVARGASQALVSPLGAAGASQGQGQGQGVQAAGYTWSAVPVTDDTDDLSSAVEHVRGALESHHQGSGTGSGAASKAGVKRKRGAGAGKDEVSLPPHLSAVKDALDRWDLGVAGAIAPGAACCLVPSRDLGLISRGPGHDGGAGASGASGAGATPGGLAAAGSTDGLSWFGQRLLESAWAAAGVAMPQAIEQAHTAGADQGPGLAGWFPFAPPDTIEDSQGPSQVRGGRGASQASQDALARLETTRNAVAQSLARCDVVVVYGGVRKASGKASSAAVEGLPPGYELTSDMRLMVVGKRESMFPLATGDTGQEAGQEEDAASVDVPVFQATAPAATQVPRSAPRRQASAGADKSADDADHQLPMQALGSGAPAAAGAAPLSTNWAAGASAEATLMQKAGRAGAGRGVVGTKGVLGRVGAGLAQPMLGPLVGGAVAQTRTRHDLYGESQAVPGLTQKSRGAGAAEEGKGNGGRGVDEGQDEPASKRARAGTGRGAPLAKTGHGDTSIAGAAAIAALTGGASQPGASPGRRAGSLARPTDSTPPRRASLARDQHTDTGLGLGLGLDDVATIKEEATVVPGSASKAKDQAKEKDEDKGKDKDGHDDDGMEDHEDSGGAAPATQAVLEEHSGHDDDDDEEDEDAEGPVLPGRKAKSPGQPASSTAVDKAGAKGTSPAKSGNARRLRPLAEAAASQSTRGRTVTKVQDKPTKPAKPTGRGAARYQQADDDDEEVGSVDDIEEDDGDDDDAMEEDQVNDSVDSVESAVLGDGAPAAGAGVGPGQGKHVGRAAKSAGPPDGAKPSKTAPATAAAQGLTTPDKSKDGRPIRVYSGRKGSSQAPVIASPAPAPAPVPGPAPVAKGQAKSAPHKPPAQEQAQVVKAAAPKEVTAIRGGKPASAPAPAPPATRRRGADAELGAGATGAAVPITATGRPQRAAAAKGKGQVDAEKPAAGTTGQAKAGPASRDVAPVAQPEVPPAKRQKVEDNKAKAKAGAGAAPVLAALAAKSSPAAPTSAPPQLAAATRAAAGLRGPGPLPTPLGALGTRVGQGLGRGHLAVSESGKDTRKTAAAVAVAPAAAIARQTRADGAVGGTGATGGRPGRPAPAAPTKDVPTALGKRGRTAAGLQQTRGGAARDEDEEDEPGQHLEDTGGSGMDEDEEDGDEVPVRAKAGVMGAGRATVSRAGAGTGAGAGAGAPSSHPHPKSSRALPVATVLPTTVPELQVALAEAQADVAREKANTANVTAALAKVKAQLTVVLASSKDSGALDKALGAAEDERDEALAKVAKAEREARDAQARLAEATREAKDLRAQLKDVQKSHDKELTRARDEVERARKEADEAREAKAQARALQRQVASLQAQVESLTKALAAKDKKAAKILAMQLEHTQPTVTGAGAGAGGS